MQMPTGPSIFLICKHIATLLEQYKNTLFLVLCSYNFHTAHAALTLETFCVLGKCVHLPIFITVSRFPVKWNSLSSLLKRENCELMNQINRKKRFSQVHSAQLMFTIIVYCVSVLSFAKGITIHPVCVWQMDDGLWTDVEMWPFEAQWFVADEVSGAKRSTEFVGSSKSF